MPKGVKGSGQSKSGLPPAAPAPSWDDVRRVCGAMLVEDVKNVLADNLKETAVASSSTAIRQFFGWLIIDKQSASKHLIKILSEQEQERPIEPQIIQLVVVAITRWIDECRRLKKFSQASASKYGTDVAYVMEWLGELPNRTYPCFKRQFVTIPKGYGNIRSLGTLDWKETDQLRGAAKERMAVELLAADTLTRFKVLEDIFLFGHTILASSNPPDGIDPAAWLMVKRLLDAEQQSWCLTGRSQFDAKNKIAPEIARLKRKLIDPRVWLAAGLPYSATFTFAPKWTRHWFNVWELPSLVRSCLGPTMETAKYVQALVCCETGWNRQPIQEMPRDPVVFQTNDKFGIGTGSFFESFKKRARHEVLAYLESGKPIRGLMDDAVNSDCQASANQIDPSGSGDGYSVLSRDNSLLNVLERYQAMTDAIRSFDIKRQHEDSFYVALTLHHGLSQGEARNLIRPNVMSGFLNRKGVTFQAIRKSYLAIQLRVVGSVAATRAFAGHRGTSVLLPHYLNTPDINAELDESIRFFQNCCQALIVGKRSEISIQLEMPGEFFEWFKRLAAASGISAAVGIPRSNAPSDNRNAIEFKPTKENLADLFLAHRALRRSRWRVGLTRWTIQALPLLACTKAIGLEILKKGLRPAYIAEARRASRLFAQGVIALPPVLGGS